MVTHPDEDHRNQLQEVVTVWDEICRDWGIDFEVVKYLVAGDPGKWTGHQLVWGGGSKPHSVLSGGARCQGNHDCLELTGMDEKTFRSWCGPDITFDIVSANQGAPDPPPATRKRKGKGKAGEETKRDANKDSMVVRVAWGDFAHLFVGDAFQGDHSYEYGWYLPAIDAHFRRGGTFTGSAGSAASASASAVGACADAAQSITSLHVAHHGSPALDLAELQRAFCLRDVSIAVLSGPTVGPAMRYRHSSCSAVGAVAATIAQLQGRTPIVASSWVPVGAARDVARFGCTYEPELAALTAPLSASVTSLDMMQWQSMAWYQLEWGEHRLHLGSTAARGTLGNTFTIVVKRAGSDGAGSGSATAAVADGPALQLLDPAAAAAPG